MFERLQPLKVKKKKKKKSYLLGLLTTDWPMAAWTGVACGDSLLKETVLSY